jgi:nicotinamidase/pyrazinamidase
VVPVLDRYIEQAREAGSPVYASRDWHPAATRHFESGGGPWPPHCIRDTEGAAFHPRLALPADARVITKGDDPVDDGYSAFEGRDADGRTLAQALRDEAVDRLLVGGLATDYCVRASVLDGLRAGLDVVVLLDAIAGIDVKPGDVAAALDAMIRAGARTATLATASGEWMS